MRYLFFIFLLIGQLNSIAQVELQKIAPLSPNSASLLRYTETNIGHHTGTAGISYPLYSINSGSLNLDLTLSYNSSGNKVEDIASWVGLGWNLGTIPAITRSVRSLTDEDHQGVSIPYMGLSLDSLIKIPHIINHPLSMDITCGITMGVIDTEPDFFHYTLLDGKSGYFYWDPYQQKYQTYPYRNLKIQKEGSGSIDGFELVDDAGNIYVFNQYESSQSSGTYAGAIERNAWYIAKVYNANKTDSLSFGYDHQTVITKTLNPVKKEIVASCPDNSSLISTTTLQAKIPFTIIFSGGMIQFVGESTYREDLQGSYALKEIQVYNNDAELVKKIAFKYFYTTGSSTDPLCNIISSLSQEKKRLFLEGFGEIGAAGDTLKYTFEYNTSITAPCRVSSAQDFWGYFNGVVNNQNLIPTIPKGKLGVAYTMIGANRFVNPNYNQFGILQKIHLPTGGTTELIYETHKVFNDGLPGKYISKQTFLLPEHETTTNTYVDTINIYSSYDLYINNSLNGGSFVDFILGDNECIGENPAPNCAQFYVRGIDIGNSDVNFPVSSNITAHHLKKGKYEIKASFAQDHTMEQGFFMLVKWQERDTTDVNRYVGGLRVKEVNHYDSLGNKHLKKYVYTRSIDSDTSSGIFLGSLDFFKLQLLWCTDAASQYVVSDNNATIVTHGGSYVGYNTVYEFTDSALQNGYTQYSFDHFDDIIVPTMPFPAPINMSEFRGRLIELKQYKKNNINFSLLYKEYNQYNDKYFNEVEIKALKTFKTIQNFNCEGPDFPNNAELYRESEYYLVPILSTLAQKTVTTYDPDNNAILTTTQTYDYDEYNYQLAKVTTTSSKGLVQEDLTYYSSDSALSGNTSDVWSTMTGKNMINIPLKKVRKVNGSVTETVVNKYQYDTVQDNIQLKELLHSYRNLTPVKEVEFLYSSDDKLLEQQKTNNIKEVYLWGYDSKYPVAKILNSTYNTASGYITQSVLNNPSNDQALRTHLSNLRSIPGALVTTYTYKPLVGLTSETDANGRTLYYEYDGFNRLMLIRDQDNRILKKYDYKYQVTPQQGSQQ